MVALKPRLEQIAEAAVRSNVGWREVRVVIENRLLRRIGVVQVPGGFGMQQEVIVDETHQGRSVDLSFRISTEVRALATRIRRTASQER
jgi:hypothetical protein